VNCLEERGSVDSIIQISFQDAGSVNIGPDAILSTSIVPVCAVKDGQLSGEGTAFCLARFTNGEAVFATANHVIREIADRPEVDAFLLFRRDLINKEVERSWVQVPIRSISYATTNSDVALLVVNVSEFSLDVTELKWFPITFGRPQEGQYCVGLGYPQAGKGSVNYDLRASRGEIEQIYPNKLTTAELGNYPSFLTNGLYEPAMSGGPIVDESGGVIGIIAHGMDTEPELVTGFGSSIGAIGELRVRLHNDTGERQEMTIPQLVEMGVLRQSDRAILRLDRNEDGVTLTWGPPEVERG
jgi:S1-C subfamily serine protease